MIAICIFTSVIISPVLGAFLIASEIQKGRAPGAYPYWLRAFALFTMIEAPAIALGAGSCSMYFAPMIGALLAAPVAICFAPLFRSIRPTPGIWRFWVFVGILAAYAYIVARSLPGPCARF